MVFTKKIKPLKEAAKATDSPSAGLVDIYSDTYPFKAHKNANGFREIADIHQLIDKLQNPADMSDDELMDLSSVTWSALKAIQDEWIENSQLIAHSEENSKFKNPQALLEPGSYGEFELRKEADLYGYRYRPDRGIYQDIFEQSDRIPSSREVKAMESRNPANPGNEELFEIDGKMYYASGSTYGKEQRQKLREELQAIEISQRNADREKTRLERQRNAKKPTAADAKKQEKAAEAAKKAAAVKGKAKAPVKRKRKNADDIEKRELPARKRTRGALAAEAATEAASRAESSAPESSTETPAPSEMGDHDTNPLMEHIRASFANGDAHRANDSETEGNADSVAASVDFSTSHPATPKKTTKSRKRKPAPSTAGEDLNAIDTPPKRRKTGTKTPKASIEADDQPPSTKMEAAMTGVMPTGSMDIAVDTASTAKGPSKPKAAPKSRKGKEMVYEQSMQPMQPMQPMPAEPFHQYPGPPPFMPPNGNPASYAPMYYQPVPASTLAPAAPKGGNKLVFDQHQHDMEMWPAAAPSAPQYQPYPYPVKFDAVNALTSDAPMTNTQMNQAPNKKRNIRFHEPNSVTKNGKSAINLAPVPAAMPTHNPHPQNLAPMPSMPAQFQPTPYMPVMGRPQAPIPIAAAQMPMVPMQPTSASPTPPSNFSTNPKPSSTTGPTTETTDATLLSLLKNADEYNEETKSHIASGMRKSANPTRSAAMYEHWIRRKKAGITRAKRRSKKEMEEFRAQKAEEKAAKEAEKERKKTEKVAIGGAGTTGMKAKKGGASASVSAATSAAGSRRGSKSEGSTGTGTGYSRDVSVDTAFFPQMGEGSRDESIASNGTTGKGKKKANGTGNQRVSKDEGKVAT